jgi:hypothetical protein
MSTKSISKDSWTSVITTSADTVFQNTSDVNPMYLTTESTSGLNFDEGFYLGPKDAVVITSGKSVSAVSFRYDSDIFYMVV